MRAFTNFALAALAAVTLVGVSAQNRDRDGDEDQLAASGLAERRQEILDMAKAALNELRKDRDAAALLDDAYGTAVFDTTKGGFVVTGAGGTGVAMRKDGSNPVFMHMGSGGVGLGAGLENYKFIILFENEDVYKRFIDGEWSAGATAQAAAGRDGAAVVGKFNNGVAVYHITDKGLIAQADVSGVRFWPSDRLNPGVG
ncbi:MAG TPA: YSC84-related protein [Gammaproteobacteria bacterium]|nr:YSC84-related protein [Gammaproteobacteria bacterium]